MTPDFEDLLEHLNAEGARYLVVGAYAVATVARIALGRCGAGRRAERCSCKPDKTRYGICTEFANSEPSRVVVRYRRNPVPGATVFFTVALADRRSTRLIDHVSALRFAFRKARAERPFDIDAIVILPDHLHAILTLSEGDADFSHRWRRIKAVFTHRVLYSGETLGRRDKTGRNLWQRRFWEHTIRDDADFSRHVDYIHINPAKHGLVQNPSDWPHSSLHRFIRQGIVAPDWAPVEAVRDEYVEPEYDDPPSARSAGMLDDVRPERSEQP